jgi:hypothetical protein
MHQSILAKRKAEAVGRIVATSRALAAQFELDPALAEALEPKGIKDPQTSEMLRLEALANLLDRIAPAADAVTTVTEDEPEPPAYHMVGEGALPAPVLDEPIEEEAPKPSPRRKKKSA